MLKKQYKINNEDIPKISHYFSHNMGELRKEKGLEEVFLRTNTSRYNIFISYRNNFVLRIDYPIETEKIPELKITIFAHNDKAIKEASRLIESITESK